MDEPILPIRPATDAPPAPGEPRTSVAPLLASYLTFGQYWGVWVVIVTDFLAFHHVTEGALGVDLAALAIVSIVSMTLLSPRLQFLPLSVTIPIALCSMAIGALLVAYGTGPTLILGFMVLGVGNGLIDVYLNVAAQGIEARERRPVLQWLHASYSCGGICGALIAGVAITAGVSFRVVIGFGALALFVTAAWSAASASVRGLPRTRRTDTAVSLTVFRRSSYLILPAVIILFAFLVEGSMDVWSGAYLRTTLDTTALVAGIAFALFSAALMVGRLSAGRVLFGIGYGRTIQISGLGAFASGLAAAATHSPIVAGVAFLFLGFFISAAAPAAFGMVGREEEDPALAVAAMSTVGYSGFVVGPPVMGWLAQTGDLRLTMLSIAVCTLGVAVCGFWGAIAGRVRSPGSTPGRG
jgi:MFS family permease